MELHDCKQHGNNAENELIVVEGLSAAHNLKRSRDANIHAIFALQGKPINAAKASLARVKKHVELQGLIQALGCGLGNQFSLDALRYKRVVLLFDPDADGIHCGALLQIFLQLHIPKLIANKKVVVVRAPLFNISRMNQREPVLAYSQAHYDKITEYLGKVNEAYQATRYKGVASLSVEQVQASCLSSLTRKEQLLTAEDALLAVQIFG